MPVSAHHTNSTTDAKTIGDDNADMKHRMAFLEIDAQTRAALQAFMPELQAVLPEILREFYAYIGAIPHLSAMFRDKGRMESASAAQAKHWFHLFQAEFDDTYIRSVRAIGMVHSKIGLEPTWYIGAYGFILNRLYRRAGEVYHSRFSPAKARARTIELIRAINQCVMIDMDMAISIYLEENKRVYDEALVKLGERFEATIGNIVRDVSATAEGMKGSAENLAGMAQQTTTKAHNVVSVSETTSANAATVSSATEEMSASIAHVAQMAQTSLQVTERAAKESDKSVMLMTELSHSINKISDVANLINEIAEQTNLLALNATIEAARAGSAGKGFAVVASEVKALAGETAKATEEIKRQVNDIGAKGGEASQSLNSVKDIIDGNRTISAETAGSAEEQKLAVDEIARNIEQTALGTNAIERDMRHINSHAEGVSGAAAEILQTIRSGEI